MQRHSEASTAADAHTRFVYVEDDGSARELSHHQCAYLATAFEPFDGGRPYIKESYNARTPDKRLRGYLERRKLPRRIRVLPARAIEWRFGGHPEDAAAWFESPAQLRVYIDIRTPDSPASEWYRTWAVTQSWVETNALSGESAIDPPLLVVADGNPGELRDGLDRLIQLGWEIIIRSATHLDPDQEEVE